MELHGLNKHVVIIVIVVRECCTPSIIDKATGFEIVVGEGRIPHIHVDGFCASPEELIVFKCSSIEIVDLCFDDVVAENGLGVSSVNMPPDNVFPEQKGGGGSVGSIV